MNSQHLLHKRPVLLTLLVCTLAVWQPTTQAKPALPQPAAGASGEIPERVPLPRIGWVQNQGQWSSRVAYRADTQSGPAFLLKDGSVVYQAGSSAHHLVERFAADNSAPALRFSPGKELPTRVSYFYGKQPSPRQQNLPSYNDVGISGVWPGVDIRLELNDGALEKLFHIAPGIDANSIRISVDGTNNPGISNNGELHFEHPTSGMVVSQSAPIAWQESDEATGEERSGVTRTSIPVRWKLNPDGSFGFDVASYDPSRPLIIDPILQLSYFGGSMDDHGAGFLHSNGDPYLIGTTLSTNLPATAGGAQADSNANLNPFEQNDIFVARFSSDLTTIRQATYLGGTEDEFNPEEQEAPNGDLILMGITTSMNFPGTSGGALASPPGSIPNANVFVTRLSADLTTLVQSTFFGGSADETANVLALDSQGDIYIQGETGSNDLPNTAGGAQAARGDALPGIVSEAYVVKIAGDLQSIMQTTYLGGSDFDMAESMQLTTQGVYVAGFTSSTDLPGTTGAAQSTPGGQADAFVTLLNSDLTAVTRTSYFGGSQFESAARIQELGGNLYLTGLTQSDDLPNVTGGAQATYGAGTPALEVTDGFIALLDPQLTSVTQATYFGGSGRDGGNLWRTGSGNLYFSGFTTSSDLPGTSNAAQPDYAGGPEPFGDAFVAALSPDLTSLIRTTYFGGAGGDSGFAITNDAGEVYLSGQTTSSDLPGTTGGIQETYGGAGSEGFGDIFVAKLSADLTTLDQATYFGGSGDDSGGVQFIPGTSNLYLVGDTTSSGLPTTTGAPQTDNAGGEDMIIAIITDDLTASGSGGGGGEPDPSGPIFSAALPGQRVHTQGNPGVTYFATIINTGTTPAVDCGLSLATAIAANFSYQITNASNQLTGTPNTPIDIPAGGSQTYLFTLTPTQSFPATEVQLNYDCANTDPAQITSGVNTVNILAASNPTPDVVAITLTTTGDGIAHIPGATGSVAFAMATVNVGASGDITLTTDTNGVDLGTNVSLCQTDPLTAQCLASPSAELTLNIAAGATPTFSIFVTGTAVIPLDPAVNRLNIRFFQGGAGATQVGQSSVALWTNPAN